MAAPSARFFVDKRVGCVAVCDSLKFDPSEQGLGEDKPWVVQFWMGCWVKADVPLAINATHQWIVPDESVRAAKELCAELNRAGCSIEPGSIAMNLPVMCDVSECHSLATHVGQARDDLGVFLCDEHSGDVSFRNVWRLAGEPLPLAAK